MSTEKEIEQPAEQVSKEDIAGLLKQLNTKIVRYAGQPFAFHVVGVTRTEGQGFKKTTGPEEPFNLMYMGYIENGQPKITHNTDKKSFSCGNALFPAKEIVCHDTLNEKQIACDSLDLNTLRGTLPSWRLEDVLTNKGSVHATFYIGTREIALLSGK